MKFGKDFWVAGLVIVGSFSAAGSSSAQTLSVNFQGARNFNQAQMDKLNLAKRMIELMINTQEFRDRVLNFTYQGRREFVQNNNLTNEQIYNQLMSGAERYPVQTAANHVMDFDLQLYTPKWYQSNNVLGYTSQSYQTIYINKNFYNNAEVNEIAMNLTHEWTHKVGFDHDFKATARRPFSVPYGIGYIMRDLANKLFK